MSGISDDEIRSAVQAILLNADLATTTERQIRKQAEAQLKADLSSSDRKQIVRHEVETFLESQEVADDTAKDEGATAVKGISSGGFGAVGLSDEMQEFLGDGTTALPRTQLVKRIWQYIKANDLQNPKDRRKIIVDDKLSRVFTPPLGMFSMNKQISKHCWTIEVTAKEKKAAKAEKAAALAALTPEERAEMEAEKEKKKLARKRKSEGLDENGEPKKRGGGLAKELSVTPELAEWIGKDTISRQELTSFFWKYVKEKELKNPEDKREILSDEALKKLTGTDRFLGFSFIKFLNSHLGPPADAKPSAPQSIKEEGDISAPAAEERQSPAAQSEVTPASPSSDKQTADDVTAEIKPYERSEAIDDKREQST